MPEGHTIYRAARDQARALAGRPVRVSSPQGRFALGAEALDGRVLERVEALGKHLFWWFEDARVVHVHLGLFGRFRLARGAEPPPPRGAVRARLTTAPAAGDEAATLDLIGPTDCSLIDPGQRDAIAARLGPDPLRRDADPARFDARVARSARPIGDLLLDQAVLAGVGNVYRAEALFVLGIDPSQPGSALAPAERAALWDVLAAMLARGVTDGRIITVEPREVGRRSRRAVLRREATYVYGRERCLRCEREIARVVLGGRPCAFCPGCQAAGP